MDTLRIHAQLPEQYNHFLSSASPRSTAMTWIHKGVRDVITMADFDSDRDTILHKIADLERALGAEKGKNELFVFAFRLFGLQIQYRRLPSG